MEGAGVAARPGLVAASGLGGPSGIGSLAGATSATAGRQRKPGRWKRIPRPAPMLVSPKQPPFDFEWVVVRKGSEDKETEELYNQRLLERAKELEEQDEDLCDSEEAKAAFRAFKMKFVSFYRKLATPKPENVLSKPKPPSDTQEEHLTAEEMEMEADRSSWPVCPQARHFATLALNYYNSNRMHKFEMARVLLSKCFSEMDGTTFAHVNFTATTPQQSASQPAKRLFFAELMLIGDLQAYESAEPMRVQNVCTIDDSCFGGCHEMVRDIKGPVRKDLDYDRCHACSERIKHPRGAQFIAGHNCTRMPYFSVFPDESHLFPSPDET
ncbi:unnamed protein product [Urochloa decumbens]|uniref:DUF3615 domain-containing protein n=1 Tax=Urochloa decumbens TaxID=240449 RepID=A0ABC8ZTZ5_9POAL